VIESSLQNVRSKGSVHPIAAAAAQHVLGTGRCRSGRRHGGTSPALGFDLDFDVAVIFSAVLWDDPAIGALLTQAGLAPNTKGNKLALLKNPDTVRTIAALPADTPLRQVLLNTGFGLVPFNPAASNGYHDGLTDMQRGALQGFLRDYADNAEALRHAVFDLHRFSKSVMMGETKLA
jgi:hypothetical protein